MKAPSINPFALLAVVFAINSAFTTRNVNLEKKDFVYTYVVYSVNQDEVHISNVLDLDAYDNSLRHDITELNYLNTDIAQSETITTWIGTNSEPKNIVDYYCDRTDLDHVCLVKVEEILGYDWSAMEYIAGDVDISEF